MRSLNGRSLMLWSVAVLLVILSPCLNCCAPHPTADAEARFQRMFGPALSSELRIVTDKRSLRPDESMTFWLQNSTGGTVWFRDQCFEVQGYAYETQTEEWVSVDLGFYYADPTPIAIEPGPPDPLHWCPLWEEDICLPEGGKLRLVVTGHTDLANPDHDQILVAYTDVAILR